MRIFNQEYKKNFMYIYYNYFYIFTSLSSPHSVLHLQNLLYSILFCHLLALILTKQKKILAYLYWLIPNIQEHGQVVVVTTK